ncbi:hypothetical protein [Halobacterium jilantaiense]|uniref:hypothetical protein n=1 Tax=Halobacterium jilantaiense TaxID=355548 RepID=UPI00115FB423|nr:hypothetical protein [Halobacterium jilantaiense]
METDILIMQSRRKFLSGVGTGLAGLSGFTLWSARKNNPRSEGTVLLQFINRSGENAKIAATLNSTTSRASISRNSALASGERNHFHTQINSGERYKIEATAEISDEEASIQTEGMPDTASVSFEKSPVEQTTTLHNEDRIIVRLSSDLKLDLDVE